MKKQSFLTGAAILMTANGISKILGAVFKIPLAYRLHERGLAVFNTAFEVYIMFLAFIISGLPFAISKLVAESSSLGDRARSHKTVRISTVLLAAIGLLGSLALYFGAPFFALAMKEEKAVYAIRMISPAIFFVALGTPFKSYYQGVSNMIPTAVSQVAEAVVKLVAGYGLAVMLLEYGMEKTAGGAIMGVTAGEIVATAILVSMYIFRKKEPMTHTDTVSAREILTALMSVALPLLCASVVSNAINVADTTLVRSRLLDAGLTNDEARFLYGAYTGYALTVFHLPVGILGTLGVSILPVIAGAIAVGDKRRTRLATGVGIRLAVILSLPCGVIMYTMSGEILNILFRNDTSAQMLRVVAPCVVMMCVTQLAASILQSAGKIMLPFFYALIGSAVKLSLEWYLIAQRSINIYGSAIASIAAYTLLMILNLSAVKKHLCLKEGLTEIMIKPVIAAGVMLALIQFIRAPLYARLGGGVVFTAVVCMAGLAVYTLLLIATNAVEVREIKRILKG